MEMSGWRNGVRTRRSISRKLVQAWQRLGTNEQSKVASEIAARPGVWRGGAVRGRRVARQAKQRVRFYA